MAKIVRIDSYEPVSESIREYGRKKDQQPADHVKPVGAAAGASQPRALDEVLDQLDANLSGALGLVDAARERIAAAKKAREADARARASIEDSDRRADRTINALVNGAVFVLGCIVGGALMWMGG